MGQIHPMPVEQGSLEAAATEYARLLQEISGSPPILDLVHLGLGPDGASIPAGRVSQDQAVVLADRAAAGVDR